jgi:hypothetical protein
VQYRGLVFDYDGASAGGNRGCGRRVLCAGRKHFYAPIPLSSRAPDDFVAAIDNGLIGRILRVLTVYQRITGPSDVALLYIYHGATSYSTLDGAALLRLASGIVEGALAGATLRESIAGPIDAAQPLTRLSLYGSMAFQSSWSSIFLELTLLPTARRILCRCRRNTC